MTSFMNHPPLNLFFRKCNILFLFTFLFANYLKSQSFTIIEEDYFCSGDGLLSGNSVPGDFNTLNPCTQYNRELPLDLIFEDNFDGNNLNTQNWVGDIHPHSGYFNGTDDNGNPTKPPTVDYIWSYWDDLNNIDKHYVIDNGTIKLIARKLNTPISKNVVESGYVCSDDPSGTLLEDCTIDDGYTNNRDFYFTNGSLNSRRKYKHGYFEARIKIPDVDGVWPAFWLAPTNDGTVGQKTTEIDIFEFTQGEYSKDQITANPSLICLPSESIADASKRMIMTHHVWYPNHTNKCHSSSAIAEDFNFSNEWHTYGLYWDDYILIWSIDGIPAKVVYRYYYEYYDIQHPQKQFLFNCNEIKDAIDQGKQIRELEGFPNESTFIILGQGVKNYGLNYNPNSNMNQACGSSTAVFPKTFEIDWVRVWARRACESEYYVCNSDHLPSNIAAKNIAFGSVYNPFTNSYSNCNVIVHNPHEADAYSSWAQVYHNGQTIDAVATENIKLLPGFKVQTGAEFRGRIEPCYGADLRSSSPSNNHIYELLDKVYSDRSLLVGIQDSSKFSNDISIFPNPSTGIYNINYPSELMSKNVDISVFDNSGRIVYFNNNVIRNIDLSSFSSGIYIIEIKTDIGVFREKIIKE